MSFIMSFLVRRAVQNESEDESQVGVGVRSLVFLTNKTVRR